MTSSLSRRAGVVQGSEPTATDPEPSSGVGPALQDAAVMASFIVS
jgi:hypothetical protein